MLLSIRNNILSALLLPVWLLSLPLYAQHAPEISTDSLDLTVVDSLSHSAEQVSNQLDSASLKAQTVLQPIQTLSDSTQRWIEQRASSLDSLLPSTEHRLPELPQGIPATIPSLPSIGSQDIALPDGPNSLPGSNPVESIFSKGKEHRLIEAAQSGVKQGKLIGDSLASIPTKLEEVSKLEKYRQPLPVDSLGDVSALRDTLVTTAAQRGEAWATQQVSEQLEGQLPEPLMAEHPQEDAMRSRLTEEALTFFDGNSEKLTQAKEQLTNLKRTYRQVKEQDSVFIKNTSLEGIPTRQRLVYGINMNPSKTGLSSWQLRSQLGYQLNKVWTVGLGGQFQAGIATEPIQVNVSWIGGYGFVQRAVARQFLLYTEVAQETESTLDEPSKGIAATWRGWVGIGKQISISGKLALQLLFLWDGFSGRDTPVRDQFQLRVGIIRSGTK